MRRQAFIYITVTDLFIAAELRETPRLRGRAFIIGSFAETVKKGDVLAVSPQARALGIREGMSVRKALKAAPEVIVCPARYDSFEALSASFFTLLGEASKRVESLGIAEAFMEIVLRGSSPSASSSLVSNSEEDIYEAAGKRGAALQKTILRELGLQCTAGIGPNKFIARLAGSMAEAGGLKIVTKNESAAFVKALPLGGLPDVGVTAQNRLKALGLKSIDEITKTPLPFLIKNFGKYSGTLIYESAHGRGPQVVVPFFDGGLGREVTFDKGVSEASVIRETLYMLTKELVSRLKAEGRLCSGLAVKVTLSDLSCNAASVELEEETDSFSSIWAAVTELLAAAPIEGRVVLLGVKLIGA